jgi:hypothetical protein
MNNQNFTNTIFILQKEKDIMSNHLKGKETIESQNFIFCCVQTILFMTSNLSKAGSLRVPTPVK